MVYRIVKTAWGWCGLIGDGSKVARILLAVPQKTKMRKMISRDMGRGRENPAAFPSIAEQIKRYFAGKEVHWDMTRIALCGTPFQQRVWRAAMAIPHGETRSYGWLARKIGRPRAARAVGGAMGRNPLPLIVPCHRVLRSDGALGGFSAEEGIALKARLLALEGKATPQATRG